MEDWDSEDFQPVAPAAKAEPLKNKWADEDVEEDNVKDSWEEEEEEVDWERFTTFS